MSEKTSAVKWELGAHCALCGAGVEVENHRLGLWNQYGEINCSGCGAEYELRMSISKAGKCSDEVEHD